MRRPISEPRVCIHPRPVEEMTDAQLEALIDLGRREAELLDELDDAVARNDRDRAWEIAVALSEAEGEVRSV